MAKLEAFWDFWMCMDVQCSVGKSHETYRTNNIWIHFEVVTGKGWSPILALMATLLALVLRAMGNVFMSTDADTMGNHEPSTKDVWWSFHWFHWKTSLEDMCNQFHCTSWNRIKDVWTYVVFSRCQQHLCRHTGGVFFRMVPCFRFFNPFTSWHKCALWSMDGWTDV